MNKIALLVVGLAISGMAVSAMAREGDSQRLAQCESELLQIYGEDTGVRLKSLSHKRGGTYMRIKAIPADGDSQLVTCRVDREGGIELLDRDGIALAAPQYDAAGKVSLND